MGKQDGHWVAIFTCAGGSNTGQTANAAGVKLAQAGLGYLACLAGVGAGAENTLKKLAQAQKVVVIDGCPVACAKGMLGKAGVKVDCYVQVTALGVKKDPGVLAPDPAAVARVCEAVKEGMKSLV
ncbi:putative zinc-binding protein [Thermodesulfitimonas autotrophica]|uniref:putative zinc-binding protein n=1 Tax=Thermodesulfitimonas autotrophica TaxID=1894989 RepID=UPI002FE2A296